MKAITILGCTGSIGVRALDVVRGLADGYRATAIFARRNWQEVRKQAAEFHPDVVGIQDEAAARELKKAGLPAGVELVWGPSASAQIAGSVPAAIVLNGIPGADGLPASLAAVRAGRTLALANKESMVMAGPLLTEEAKRRGVVVLPVDSEHNAIFQAMHCGGRAEVRKIYLTASGGPFRTRPASEFDAITVEEATKHPNWDMGQKITIDSATMMNKALEIVEARWLFDLLPERIEVLVHPQSIIHSMVEYRDGSVIAQLGAPDMRTPIQYALTYPERRDGVGLRLDLAKALRLDLEPPDLAKFPSVGYGFDAARAGGTMGAVMNAVNEEAVAAFVARRLKFRSIFDVVKRVMDRHKVAASPSLEQILGADRWARDEAARALA